MHFSIYIQKKLHCCYMCSIFSKKKKLTKSFHLHVHSHVCLRHYSGWMTGWIIIESREQCMYNIPTWLFEIALCMRLRPMAIHNNHNIVQSYDTCVFICICKLHSTPGVHKYILFKWAFITQYWTKLLRKAMTILMMKSILRVIICAYNINTSAFIESRLPKSDCL